MQPTVTIKENIPCITSCQQINSAFSNNKMLPR